MALGERSWTVLAASDFRAFSDHAHFIGKFLHSLLKIVDPVANRFESLPALSISLRRDISSFDSSMLFMITDDQVENNHRADQDETYEEQGSSQQGCGEFGVQMAKSSGL